jgi:hypothetical protein
MSSNLRLLLSAVIAFVFYFGWAYWANSNVDINNSVTLRAALVQGSFSGFTTLFFTLILEKLHSKYGKNCLSLTFVVPILCSVHSKSKQNIAIFNTLNYSINTWAKYFKSNKLSATILIPLLPIAVQTSLVIGINSINNTPNLWLTVFPSIFFSSVYGYVYTFTLLKNTPEKM